MSSPKRRLPVLKSAPPLIEGDGDDRPAWHWAFLGAVLVFLLWAPLAMLAQALVARLVGGAIDAGDPSGIAAHLANAGAGERARFWGIVVGLPAFSFVLGAGLGGLLVGRLGGRAGVKEATAAGLIAACTVSALAAVRVGLVSSFGTFAVLSVLGGLSAWAGGRIGWRLRGRA